MNRTTAIIATIVTALFCGLPGIGLVCFAALGMVGTNLPGFYEENPTATPGQAMLGAVFSCASDCFYCSFQRWSGFSRSA